MVQFPPRLGSSTPLPRRSRRRHAHSPMASAPHPAGAHPTLTGQGAGACPVAGVATPLPTSAAAAEPASRVPAATVPQATVPQWTPDAEAVVRERAEMWRSEED